MVMMMMMMMMMIMIRGGGGEQDLPELSGQEEEGWGGWGKGVGRAGPRRKKVGVGGVLGWAGPPSFREGKRGHGGDVGRVKAGQSAVLQPPCHATAPCPVTAPPSC